MGKKYSAYGVTRLGLVAACYMVLTMILAPLSFGIGVRLGEGLNFLGLYDKRYVYGITIGVFLVNYFSYGPVDMVVGSLSSLVFITLGVDLAEWIVARLPQKYWEKIDPMMIKYLILGTIFTISMVTIALMIMYLGNLSWDAFPALYGGLMLSEAISLLLGGSVMYFVGKRLDLRIT